MKMAELIRILSITLVLWLTGCVPYWSEYYIPITPPDVGYVERHTCIGPPRQFVYQRDHVEVRGVLHGRRHGEPPSLSFYVVTAGQAVVTLDGGTSVLKTKDGKARRALRMRTAATGETGMEPIPLHHVFTSESAPRRSFVVDYDVDQADDMSEAIIVLPRFLIDGKEIVFPEIRFTGRKHFELASINC